MKTSITFLLYLFMVKIAFAQPAGTRLIFGKYKGVQVKFYTHVSDTTDRVEHMNKACCTKILILDSSGNFSLEFQVPGPTTRIYPKRYTRGKWARVGDTLILNTLYSYSDFIKVKERKTAGDHIQVSVTYQVKKRYYPDVDVIINDVEKATAGKTWVYFPLDTVEVIKIGRYAGPTSWEREWLYRTKNSNANYFKISVKSEIKGNDFVMENYKLLIKDASLIQLKEAFGIDVKKFDLVDDDKP